MSVTPRNAGRSIAIAEQPAPELVNTTNTLAWESKAGWWDGLHGDAGNAFHQTVVEPAVLDLLALQPGERVLDIGCGSGQLARQLAGLGAQVVATDAAAAFLPLAAARSSTLPPEVQDRLTWKQVDATDEDALAALGEGAFDAAVSTMALMDIPDIDPLHRAVARLLRPGGRFVVALAHPAFNQSGINRLAEWVDEQGSVRVEMSLRIRAYLTPRIETVMGAPGEPVPHYDFHRPLHALLAHGFAAGLALDGLLEPSFPVGSSGSSLFSWQAYSEIPPTLVYRLRKPA